MEALGIFTAFGLSASAGLNAYIPLLVIALVARFSNLIHLNQPWDALTSWWIIGLLLVLNLVEFFADKVPAVNHVNDIIQTIIRPIAGAIAFAAGAGVFSDIHPGLCTGKRIAHRGWSPCSEKRGRPSDGDRSHSRCGQCSGQHRGGCYIHSRIHPGAGGTGFHRRVDRIAHELGDL